MARRPRPVNPEEGPVQAFAFDLRALRESAGNPTYRTLAKTAGYSATTLGDAAGGTHLPTLEVALAYAGACGGDVAQWRARWQEVNRQVARGRAEAAEDESASEPVSGPVSEPASGLASAQGSGPAQDAGRAAAAQTVPPLTQITPAAQTAHVANAVHPPTAPTAPIDQRRLKIRASGPWIAVGAALVGVLGAALAGVLAARQPGADVAAAVRASSSEGAAHTSAAPHCPAKPATGTAAAFTGMTYGSGANVRTGASMQSPVRFRIPPGCAVAFSGYCLGDIVVDPTAGTPDMRWFIIQGEGEVASAIVHGNPPGLMAPQPCPQDVPAPASVTLGVEQAGTGDGVVELSATGSRLWIVGFAAYYSLGGSAAADWHQFGFGDGQTGGTFDSTPLRLPAGSAAVPVAAVACLGGDGPTGVLATAAVRPEAPQTLQALPAQSAASLAAAENAACHYPREGG